MGTDCVGGVGEIDDGGDDDDDDGGGGGDGDNGDDDDDDGDDDDDDDGDDDDDDGGGDGVGDVEDVVMSCYTGVQLTSRWSNCIWTPAKSDFSSSSVSGTARRWLTKRYPLRRVDAVRTPKCVAKCGSCLSLGNPLRRSRVPDGQTCGVVKCETSLPAATVCRDRAFRKPKHVVECECLLGTGNPLQRSRRLDIQICGKMQIWWGPAQPLRTKWLPTVKNWFKIVILKVQMQAWHESQTAITVGKLRFLNVRCKRSRIGVKLRLYPFWNVRHNRLARKKLV